MSSDMLPTSSRPSMSKRLRKKIEADEPSVSSGESSQPPPSSEQSFVPNDPTAKSFYELVPTTGLTLPDNGVLIDAETDELIREKMRRETPDGILTTRRVGKFLAESAEVALEYLAMRPSQRTEFWDRVADSSWRRHVGGPAMRLLIIHLIQYERINPANPTPTKLLRAIRTLSEAFRKEPDDRSCADLFGSSKRSRLSFPKNLFEGSQAGTMTDIVSKDLKPISFFKRKSNTMMGDPDRLEVLTEEHMRTRAPKDRSTSDTTNNSSHTGNVLTLSLNPKPKADTGTLVEETALPLASPMILAATDLGSHQPTDEDDVMDTDGVGNQI